MNQEYDLLIIGGGINGAGIARDAAGRGLKVLLTEKGDLAGATSSASTKLIHGGLRYLEYGELGLVRDSLKERETLLSLAPHIIRPLNFILPHDARQRPYWMIFAGLKLYDHLASRRRLPKSRMLNFSYDDEGKPLQGLYRRGFVYADCWADDSRLVALNAMDAAAQGAEIATRTQCVNLRAQDGIWRAKLKSEAEGETDVSAKTVINATGPWVREIIERSGLAGPRVPGIRLVKGSHIIVKKLLPGQDAYILQQPDKRIVFVIPYQDDYTLIGTTEEKFDGPDPADPKISESEIEYLCGAFNASFKDRIEAADVQWTFSGVRPLLDDGKDSATAVTRDYLLFRHEDVAAPLISVFGGKLTTYRVLAEKAVSMILDALGRFGEAWTARAPLPGGDIPHGDMAVFFEKKAVQYKWLPPDLLRRYAASYGTRLDRFLEGAKSISDLGEHYGDGLYEAEVVYLMRQEWAQTAEDILWRRTKIGLKAAEETVAKLEKALRVLSQESR